MKHFFQTLSISLCFFTVVIPCIGLAQIGEGPSGLSIDDVRRMASEGNRDAQYEMGLLGLQSISTNHTHADFSVDWFFKSAVQGHSGAEFYLGKSHDSGRFRPRDVDMAVYWYGRAAEAGVTAAQVNLASIYEGGDGVDPDYTKAIFWYTEAASTGNVSSKLKLGELYLGKKGVERNIIRSYAWFQSASDSGSETASEILTSVEFEMTPEQINESRSYLQGLLIE